jgi:hypothetical protein
MRDLTKDGGARPPAHPPKGLAFDIADHALVRRWTEGHDCRISVRLDHGTDGEEYEEVIAVHTGTSSHCQLIMWRNSAAVFVQPIIGRMQRYRSVAEALKNLDVKPRIVLTDIIPTSWIY